MEAHHYHGLVVILSVMVLVVLCLSYQKAYQVIFLKQKLPQAKRKLIKGLLAIEHNSRVKTKSTQEEACIHKPDANEDILNKFDDLVAENFRQK
jgi:predicted Holliday junction resolvase-like endonuclease